MKNKGIILKTCTYFLVMVLVTMSILVACAKEAPAPTTTGPAPAPTTTGPAPAPTTTGPAPTTKAPPPTKVLFGTAAEPQTMDISTSRSIPNDYPILQNIYDPLVGYLGDGKPDPTVGVASYQISADGKVLTFTLRKGVKFHNGDPLTTKDVEFTHNRMVEKSPAYPTDMRDFDRLEVVDDYTIRFIFKKPNVRFILEVYPQFLIVSKSYYEKVGEQTFITKPVGTGAYKFVEWKTGQYLDLERNEDYWGKKPAVKQARLLFAKEDTTRVAMLKAGEVDIIDVTPWQNVGELQKAGFKTAEIACAPDISIQFQTLNPNVPWYDKRVRQAVAYAIDRKSIVNNMFYGIPGLYGWLAPGEVGYDPAIKPYPYDVAKAKALLAEAGYPNGFDMPFYYSVGASGGIVGMKDVAESVILYLNAIGIKCKPVTYEGPQGLDLIRKAHADINAQFVTVSGFSTPNNVDPIVSLQRGLPSTNPTSVCNIPEIDALIDKGLQTFDDTERGEIIKQIIRIMNDELPAIQVLSNKVIFAMKPGINFTPSKRSFRMLLIKDFS